MNLDENKFPELMKLVNEVKSGQRVLLFPPGAFIFAVTLVVLTIASTLCFIAAFMNFYSGRDGAVLGVAQLISMPLILAATVLPGILAARGKVGSINWFKGYSLFVCLVSTLGLLVNVIYLNNSQAIPFVISLLLGVFTFISTRSPSFTLLVYYLHFLRKK